MNTGDIFRKEALEYHRDSRPEGELLLMLPGWARWSYWLLVTIVSAAVLFLLVGSISQYAEGPAVIRAAGRVMLTATAPGVVATVLVMPGEQVRAGALIAEFRSEEETAEVSAAERDFQSALVRMLADPRDDGARQAVATIRARRDLLMKRLQDRSIRAPVNGVVGDIRVRPGQLVSPGDVIGSISDGLQGFSVVALIPGRQRPNLKAGQALRLELDGYRYVYHNLRVNRIDEEVVGPQEVRRILGRELADGVSIAGPVVVLHAVLLSQTFQVGGRTYEYFDGMHGSVYVRLGSERLLTTLLPRTKIITETTQ